MSTKCINCNKPHWLRDEDAGSDMEILKLCKKCYNNKYEIVKIHKPVSICSTCNAKKIDDKCFICNPPF